MYITAAVVVAAVFWTCAQAAPSVQIPLYEAEDTSVEHTETLAKRPLHGRFLHVTDFHPDRFYKIHSSTSGDGACHRGHGPAGFYGAEVSDCDSPISLINETFAWIEKELRDKIDFVIWTGDSARHDNDEEIPRNAEQVVGLNEFMVHKMFEAFGKHNGDERDDDPNNDYVIPIIPTFGNNDILPHNVMTKGPNTWLRTYARVWRQFIPEAQKHQFEQGGWFFVEVIPNKLVVFSLNTLYFFTSNAAADGCAAKSEPGFQQMEWLRIQLQFMRERGIKAILTGHVPPIHQSAKSIWDETCWQKYNLWLKQYRDVIIAGMYGHFNYDHFLLQDFDQIDRDTERGRMSASSSKDVDESSSDDGDDDVHASLSSDYWLELRNEWSELPKPPKSMRPSNAKDYLRDIGGPYAERFATTYVSASVVPNLFPAIRVFEYNITGLGHAKRQVHGDLEMSASADKEMDIDDGVHIDKKKKKKKKKKKNKKAKKRKFTVPDPPSKSSPPGPAYSPQTLSLLKYTQYFANLTHINNDFVANSGDRSDSSGQEQQEQDHAPKPKPFTFEVHYNTADDGVYRLKDLTVPNILDLARRIGAFEAEDSAILDATPEENEIPVTASIPGGVESDEHKGGKKKNRSRRKVNLPWYTFISRAFVETRDPEDIRQEFG